jgi:predicted RNA-binding protein with RPS1 domain
VPVTGKEKFGVLVEFLPSRTGLVHTKDLGSVNLDDLEVGSTIDVKLLEVGFFFSL